MTEKTINYIKLPDGETYKIGGSGSGFNLFDTKISDHILEGEEALGWALQGTYVYKEGVAGSRTGYPDFYAKCLDEKENSTTTETTLGDDTITMYVNGNGHKFYDIADKAIVDTFYNAMGSAWFYGVDTENERIFLPRDKYFAITASTGTAPVIGNGLGLGLTNGTTTGSLFGGSEYLSSTTIPILRIKPDTLGQPVGTNASGRDVVSTTIGVTENPDNSGLVADVSSVVQPNENKYLYICVGNTKVESAITNVTEITTSENDTLPLFHNFYSKEDMTTTGAYVNASLGSWLSGNVYTTAYNELVNKLGTDNVKANTDTYTDYDFVVNQDDMTFRLPLLNGDENIADYSNGITVTYPTSTAPFIAPTSGDFVVCVQFGSSVDRYLYINGVKTSYLIHNTSEYQDTSSITVSLQKGDSVYFDQISGTKQVLSFYPYKGNGNLYYKLANAVTNLEILDVAKVTSDLNTKLSRGNKEEIIAWGIPDWSTAVSIQQAQIVGATYTFPYDGVLITSFAPTATATLTINGVNLPMTYVTGTSCFIGNFAGSQGTTVTIDAVSRFSSVYFLKFKGAN